MYHLEEIDSYDIFISDSDNTPLQEEETYTPEEDEYEEIEENIEDFLDDTPINTDTDWDKDLTDEIDYDQFEPED
ncbi:hypothetical protein WKV44_10205 [Spirochaetia bacterium 38H-sp]|uniref:Uncharacterized protein n=1 Tax=Rarispira pelagica TaxID=3141764 RepID=A0ABU9UE09_9SPIR